MPQLQVESPNVTYSDTYIESQYFYHSTIVDRKSDGTVKAAPTVTTYTLRTERTVPKLGVMLVGWGGNNGSTVTAMVLANRHGTSWHTKEGVQKANYYGSITQSSTVLLGYDSVDGNEVFHPLRDFVPMVNPNDIVFDGWDISSMNIGDAMHRAKVLDYHLQQTLHPYMKNMKPRQAIFDGDFVAANQKDRADNVLHGTKWEQVETVRSNIREFKANSGVDVVIVVWTANTERFCDIRPGIHDTAENLLKAIHNNHREISPSTMYAVASALEGCSFINGSPQNTLVPGLVELATENGVFVGGDDFKSGQTKLKSVLVDFLVSAGIKPRSIVSYNHLGNNDGLNLSAPSQFKSKEESKKGVVEDIVSSNSLLYQRGETPDHCIVIKYVPYVGDSKRAMDEYVSEIAMGGSNIIVIHNTCEDSLLASPLILDLVVLAELMQRVHIRATESFESFHAVLSILGYLLKAPVVPEGAPVVNPLFRQRAAIENLLRALVGLPALNHMDLEHRLRTQGKVKPGDQSSGVSSDEELHQEL